MKYIRIIKNVLLIACLSLSLISAFSKCQAYTQEDFDEFIIQLLENDSVDSYTKNSLIVFNQKKSNMYNYMSNNGYSMSNYKGVSLYFTGSGYYYTEFKLFLIKSTDTITQSGTGYFSNCEYINMDRNGNCSRGSSSSYPFASTSSTLNYIGLLDGLIPLNNNMYFENYYTSMPIDFIPYSDGIINVLYNGTSGDFMRFNVSRSVSYWALGRIDGYEDTYKVDVKLFRYMNSEFTTLVGSAQWYLGQIGNYGLSITDDGVVYIRNDLLFYNQGYTLTVDVDGENKINLLFYFVPYGSNATSGDLLSPDIDTNSDLQILQNLQELVNIQNIGSIYDSNFSGDSGDVLLGTLDYKTYDNNYSNYITSTLLSLKETMLGSGDVAFSFNFMGNNMTVHSNDFYVPDGVLKFFVTSFLVFATIYYLYVQASHFFHKLQEGDFEGALETYSVNDESVLM